MALGIKVPTLADSNVVIRLAMTPEEIDAANQLVYRNYVNLYWPDDKQAFYGNKYLRSPARHVFAAFSAGRVVGTMSIIEDSSTGLPSDTSHPAILNRYRRNREELAEVMSFAVDQSIKGSTALTLFLIKFLFQYTCYYTNVDRLIASCRPKHADFYEEWLCFEKLTVPAPHAYAGNVECQLLTLDLLEAHLLLSRRYKDAGEARSDMFRFLLIDGHPSVRLPARDPLRRSHHSDYAGYTDERYRQVAV